MKRTLSLPQRRLAVVVQLLSYPLVFWFTQTSLIAQPARSIAALLTVMLWAGSVWYLFYRTDLWAFGNAPDEQLDERQNIVRNYAYRNAYITLSTVVLFMAVYYMIAIDLRWWLPTSSPEATVLVFTLLGLTLALPSTLIAWTEREV